MLECRYLHHLDVSHLKILCDFDNSVHNFEKCQNCPRRFYRFTELGIGSSFYCVNTVTYGIKVSNSLYFDLGKNKLCRLTNPCFRFILSNVIKEIYRADMRGSDNG